MSPRYLVPFHPKQVPHFFTDVLIIGGGLAGLRAANAVDSRLNVLVVTKDTISESNSTYAQGGIAGVLDPDDSIREHVVDTLVAGGSLCDERVVEMVVSEAPRHIRELMEWGTHFDEGKRGELDLGREGGHSHNRIVHALGDSTGKEVMRAVIARTLALPNVQVWENGFTLDLLTHEGACRGAIIHRQGQGRVMVWARQTILATGGCGQIYRESTNPLVATGDGHALAWRAGAELRDMEFIQFHPTVLYIAGGSRSLITEAARGEGGRLVDKNGVRFMPDFDGRAELAPRDVVARAIVTQMERTQHPCVYLDLSHLDKTFVKTRFPGIAAACLKFGIDIANDRIPVRPGAHYMIGGVRVDLEGRTSVPGLWGAGEVTSSGLHGANRLASNSLLEGLVYGARAGQAASRVALAMQDDFRALPLAREGSEQSPEPLDVADIRNSLKALMWRAAGVRRDGNRLADALEQVEQWKRYVLVREFDDIAGWELQNLLTIAGVIIRSALQREESRGVHQRIDFPATDDAHWNRHITCIREEETG